MCREKRPKKELMRVVRTPEGEVLLDPTGRLNGRGSYVCASDEDGTGVAHWGDEQIRAKLAHALKTELTQEDIERLGQAAMTATD